MIFQEPSWQWGTIFSLTTLLVATTKYGHWVMAKWVWIIRRSTLTEKNWCTGRRIYLSVTLFTTNLTRAPLSSKEFLRVDRPLTDRLRHGRAGAGISTHLNFLHLTATLYTILLPKRMWSWRPSQDSKFLQSSDKKLLQVQGSLYWLLFCRASRNYTCVLSRVLAWTSWLTVTTTGPAKMFLVRFSSMILGWEIWKYCKAHAHWKLETSGYRHTHILCNTYCFSTTTKVTRTPHNVTLHVQYVCVLYWYLLCAITQLHNYN